MDTWWSCLDGFFDNALALKLCQVLSNSSKQSRKLVRRNWPYEHGLNQLKCNCTMRNNWNVWALEMSTCNKVLGLYQSAFMPALLSLFSTEQEIMNPYKIHRHVNKSDSHKSSSFNCSVFFLLNHHHMARCQNQENNFLNSLETSTSSEMGEMLQ